MSGSARERNWSGTETLLATCFVPGTVVESAGRTEQQFHIEVSVNGGDETLPVNRVLIKKGREHVSYTSTKAPQNLFNFSFTSSACESQIFCTVCM